MRCGSSLAMLGLLTSGALLSPPPSAQAQTPQPGLWRTTVKVQMSGVPGMPAGAAAQENTGTQCITPQEAKDPSKGFTIQSARGAQDCKHSSKWAGSVLTYEMKCGGQNPSATSGAMTFESPTRFRGTQTTTSSMGGQRFQMVAQMEGQRVGECPR